MIQTDNNQKSGSRRVKMKIWGGFPSFKRNVSRHHVSCLLVLLELRVMKVKKKNMDQGYDFHIWCFGILFSFHI